MYIECVRRILLSLSIRVIRSLHHTHPHTSHTLTLTHGPERWEAGLEEGEEEGKEGVQLDQFAVEEVLVCEGGHWEGRGHPLGHT